MIDFFKNLSVNLRATGPAAIVLGWFAAMAFLATQEGALAGAALGFVGVAIIPILKALGTDIER